MRLEIMPNAPGAQGPHGPFDQGGDKALQLQDASGGASLPELPKGGPPEGPRLLSQSSCSRVALWVSSPESGSKANLKNEKTGYDFCTGRHFQGTRVCC
jgi:hypothetical protein